MWGDDLMDAPVDDLCRVDLGHRLRDLVVYWDLYHEDHGTDEIGTESNGTGVSEWKEDKREGHGQDDIEGYDDEVLDSLGHVEMAHLMSAGEECRNCFEEIRQGP